MSDKKKLRDLQVLEQIEQRFEEVPSEITDADASERVLQSARFERIHALTPQLSHSLNLAFLDISTRLSQVDVSGGYEDTIAQILMHTRELFRTDTVLYTETARTAHFSLSSDSSRYSEKPEKLFQQHIYHRAESVVQIAIQKCNHRDPLGILTLVQPRALISMLGDVAALDDILRSYSQLCANSIAQALLLQHVRKEADYDMLTKLLNRQGFQRAFLPLEKAHKDGQDISLLLIDINRFKGVNDLWGHAYGDYVLQEVATALQSNFRDRDIVGRLGGEEFVIGLYGADAGVSRVVAMRVYEAVARLSLDDTKADRGIEKKALQAAHPPFYPYGPSQVTVSIGIAVAPAENSSHAFSFLCSQADRALYDAKLNIQRKREDALVAKDVTMYRALGRPILLFTEKS